MNAAHTPVKWTVQIGDPSRGAVAYWVSPSSIEEAQAHRAIIEQAPQLLAQCDSLKSALEYVMEYLTSPPFIALHGEQPSQQTRAALALVKEGV